MIIGNELTMPWLERIGTGQLVLKIASRDLLDAGIAVRLSSVNALFTNEIDLNEASTMIQRMKVLCRGVLGVWKEPGAAYARD